MGVEFVFQETFLPCTFYGKSKSLPSIIGNLSTMPVKKSVLGLECPVTLANDKYQILLRASIKLIGSVTRASEFSTHDHLHAVKEERRDGKKTWDDVNAAKLKVIVKNLPTLDCYLFLRAKHTDS